MCDQFALAKISRCRFACNTVVTFSAVALDASLAPNYETMAQQLKLVDDGAS